jgi:copper chaperone NosL
MTRLPLLFIVTLTLAACSTEPEPLQFGTDVCYNCKMTLMDSKFGAEIVTRKGKIYKFDDVNCMLRFYHSGEEPESNMKHRLVIDYAHPATLIDATNAWYLKSDSIRTPMASKVAAFSGENDYSPWKKKWKAILMSWGEAVTQFK